MGDNSPQNDLEKLRQMAKLAKFGGVDILKALDQLKDEWFSEFKNSFSGPAAAPAEINIDDISKQVIAKLDIKTLVNTIATEVETRVATKIAEIMDVVSKKSGGAPADTQNVVAAVIALLKPEIESVQNKLSQQLDERIMTNFKAMQTEIYKQLDARAPVPQQTPDGQAVQQAPAAGGGGILGALLNNPQIAEKLIDKFLGGGQAAQQSTTEIILKAWLQGLSAGNKLKVGQVTPDELLSNVNTILNPANPGAVNPPAAPAK